MGSKPDGKPFTRHCLWLALLKKVGTLPADHGPDGGTARQMADAITEHGLTDVLTGFKHDGKPIRFHQGYELVFGERLTLSGGRKRA